MRAADHVHLTEIRGRRVWNPLAPGGIAPYRDRTVPAVDAIFARPVASLLPFDPQQLCGTVSLVTAAHDTPPLRRSRNVRRLPGRAGARDMVADEARRARLRPDVPAADFRTTLPIVRNFWNVYARGSYQNAPRFSNQQFLMPGRFLYNLAETFDTRSYPERDVRGPRPRQRHARQLVGRRRSSSGSRTHPTLEPAVRRFSPSSSSP